MFWKGESWSGELLELGLEAWDRGECGWCSSGELEVPWGLLMGAAMSTGMDQLRAADM